MHSSRLLKLRMALGWSQEKMASELGVSSKTVYRWESGLYKPSPLATEKINNLRCKVFSDFFDLNKALNI